MKNVGNTTIILSILILIILSASAFGQFKGKMVFDSMDKESSYDVYYCDLGYRYEFDEDGQQGVVIVKSGSKDVIILMPEQKMAMKTSSNNPMSMANDPLQSFENFKDKGILKEEGEETVNGILCKISILYSKDNPSQKVYTMWYSEEYKFPMKMINHVDGSEDSGMEMKDVESWKPDPSKFEIPSGYQLMDMPGMMPNK